jgi:hypothetical protein
MKRKIILGLFVLAIILFLLPWVSLSCAGTTMTSASGLDMITGKHYETSSAFGSPSDNEMDSQPLAIAALAVAVIGIILSLVNWKRAFILRVGLGIAGVVLLIALKLKLDKEVTQEGQGMLQINYLFGYWMTMICFAAASVVNFFKDNVMIKFQRVPDRVETDKESLDKKPPGENVS